MAKRTYHLVRICFVIFVVFFSIYFLLSPKNTKLGDRISAEPTLNLDGSEKVFNVEANELAVKKRRLAEEKAIRLTREAIKESIIPSLNISGIPGTRIRTEAQLRTFRRQLECVTSRGYWEYDPKPHHILKHKQDPLYGKCDRVTGQDPASVAEKALFSGDPDAMKEWGNIGEYLKYVWKTPNECPLSRISVEEMCKLITGMKLNLVGDTIGYMFHDLILDYFRDGPVQCYGELYCKAHTLCPGSSDGAIMRYTRSDLLTSQTSQTALIGGHPNVKNVEIPFLKYAHLSNVFILNKGHHWQKDSVYRSSLIDTMIALRKKLPNALVVFRATSPGHLNCHSAEKPLSSPPSAIELENLPYHWGDIHRQNLIAREIVQETGGVYLDVETAMTTRIDGHIGSRDCLRWCIPGPADIWVDFLLYILIQLRYDPASVF